MSLVALPAGVAALWSQPAEAAAAPAAVSNGAQYAAPLMDPATSPWKAQTIVSDADIELLGLDAWFRAEPVSDETFVRMWTRSWKENCTLERSELRYLKMIHRNAMGQTQRGEMVVNAAIADKVLRIFKKLYVAGYRIERMVLIDDFGGNDELSMQANNSSSFNFRFMTHSPNKVSKHGMGLAIDINPLYNPYVKKIKEDSWIIAPETAQQWAFDRKDRTDIPYKIDQHDLAYKLFTEEGFVWGGNWRSAKDYQHFEYKLK
ncbi:M15 family metallopeptidase [Anaerobiospirillum sp. NML120511]|nr:M15 family metallopeptidase [Anaerobiospirillum sp. NML120511]MCK0535898.1 M15 family metallopeptidase [Anaerobiospirillum sp. NML120511]